MTLGELLQQGGWAMVPIYLCSIAGLAVFLKKLSELRSARLRDTAWVEPMLIKVRSGDFGAAHESLRATRHPGGRVAAATLRTLHRRPERAEAEGQRVGSLELQRLEAKLSVLAFIAQVAPLLGLLGTVLGMVELFVGLQGSDLTEVDTHTLSAGIWKALLTTAAGLAVAVPALAGHAWLTSRTDALRLHMTDTVQRILSEAPPIRSFEEAS